MSSKKCTIEHQQLLNQNNSGGNTSANSSSTSPNLLFPHMMDPFAIYRSFMPTSPTSALPYSLTAGNPYGNLLQVSLIT